MITTELYATILSHGLLLDHYNVLKCIAEGTELPKYRVQGFINLLHKKGYLEDGALTQKSKDLLAGNISPAKRMQVETNFDFAAWVVDLHDKCQGKIYDLTGKRQIRDKIDGKAYSFLPNVTDLGRVLLKAIKSYKLKDFDKIEKTILKYIETCARAGKWFPVLNYYIYKNTGSPMVTDMDMVDEESNDNPSIHIV